MFDICFVILNYNLYQDTISCVASIKNRIDTRRYKIIIVDNASVNGAGELLREYFKNDQQIEIILLAKNIGFAKGNNIGINQARLEGASFICCINDDAEILSKNFFQIINEKYTAFQPALIGPKIINRNGEIDDFSHPFRSIREYEEILERIKKETFGQYKKRKSLNLKSKVRSLVDQHKLSRRLFRQMKLRLRGIDPYKMSVPLYTQDTEDLVMSGCCLIFTPVFFKQLKGFNEATFLYWEEEFLQASMLEKGLHSLYIPEIEILHKEGVSTETLTSKKVKKKWSFMREHFIESLTMFLSYLKAHEKEIYKNEHRS